MAEFNEENIQNDDFLNIQELLSLCLAKWKWFALSLILAVCCAVFYVLRTPPVYTRSASILIKEEGKGSGSLSGEFASFADMGVFSSGTNVYNELITIQSPALMWEVVKRLRLDVNYKEEGTFHDNTLYGESLPVRVNFLDPDTKGSFELEVNAKGNATLTAFIVDGDKVQGNAKGNVGDTLTTPLGKLVVQYADAWEGKDVNLKVGRTSVFGAASGCSAAFTASLNNKNATVIDMSYDDVSTRRAEDILNTLIAVYNENWVKDRLRSAPPDSLTRG